MHFEPGVEGCINTYYTGYTQNQLYANKKYRLSNNPNKDGTGM
jgi:hypothetical protein